MPPGGRPGADRVRHLEDDIGDSVRVGDLTAPPASRSSPTHDTMVLAVVEPAVMDTELDLAVAGEEARRRPQRRRAEAEAAEGEAAEGEAA